MSDARLAFRSTPLVLAIVCAVIAPPAARAEPPAAKAGAQAAQAGARVGASNSVSAHPAGGRPGTAGAGGAKAAGAKAAGVKATGTKAAAEKAPADEARELFDRGIAAHDAGKLAEAERLFAEAWGKQRSWDIAANLGIVERKLHRDVAAAEHLSFALGALPPSESDRTRKALARELAAAAAKAGKVTIRSDVAGAVVRVGGRLRGTTPLEGPVFEAPGQVRIELTKDGFEPAAREVSVEAGGAVEVTLSPKPRPDAGRSMVGPAIAFGAAGVGLVTGLVAGGIAMATMDDLRSKCGPDLVCPERLRGEADAGRVAAHVGTAGFVTAGVGAIVGLTLLLVPDRTAPAKVGASAAPGFVGVRGEF